MTFRSIETKHSSGLLVVVKIGISGQSKLFYFLDNIFLKFRIVFVKI